ncbi:MAG: hypothetical protein PVI01_04535 [Gemmatimonadales bacterium]|jgi:hypothetical protein
MSDISGESSTPDGGRRPSGRSATASRLRDVAVTASLALVTLAVVLVYVTQPQSPTDLADRLVLMLDSEAYGANLRRGESLHLRAARARGAGVDSTAEASEWGAARAFAAAAAAAAGPSEELAANDGLADVLLVLGHDYLARGRGGLFGWGQDRDVLAMAESVAACAVTLSPTRRRRELDAFVQQLEEELERPIAGRCPT